MDKLKKPEAFEIWMKQNVAAVYKETQKFVFADADIDVEYLYAFITRKSEKAYVILRVADNDAATTVLLENGVELLDEATFHELM